MKRLKNEPVTIKRFKLPYIFLGVIALYLCFICLEFPDLFESAKVLSTDGDGDWSMDGLLLRNDGDEGELNKSGLSSLHVDRFHAEEGELNKSALSSVRVDSFHRILENNENHSSVLMPRQSGDKKTGQSRDEKNGISPPIKPIKHQYGQITVMIFRQMNRIKDISSLDTMVDEAWHLGLTEWEEVVKFDEKEIGMKDILEGKPESCPSWLSVTGKELAESDYLMFLPCGLAAGSSVTVIGTPHYAHQVYVPQLAKLEHGNGMVLVSQFIVELQGLKAVDGEDPPKIFHVNPRLRGDWSGRPVIEHNTCYRMQWGHSQRCDGLPSKDNDDEDVDGYLRCEKWARNDLVGSRVSKIFSWFQRFTGRAKRPEVTWPFPFVEGRMFVLTVRAGLDGYHVNAGGRHVTSFPYRTGFSLEDATGLSVRGDIDVHSIYATSLPTSHPSFSPQRVLDFSEKWKSSPVPKNPVKLFIGVLSSTNHFAERMAVRQTWMQSSAIKSSKVVVRFFVALNPRRQVNAVLKKEAAYFGDIVILPFMDRYELVVLKTVAICLYGVQNISAAFIMKCDDDNFVRVESVLKEIDGVSPKKSLYMGNLNLFHVPLRSGKWAVSYEEWPEGVYPPYANGPGYIISIDIAKFIVAQHQKHSLRLFKMEDVSMGMWIEQFNSSTPVEYSDNWRFCQFGCVEEYITAHYQSPRQMDCLWKNLAKGNPHCCNW